MFVFLAKNYIKYIPHCCVFIVRSLENLKTSDVESSLFKMLKIFLQGMLQGEHLTVFSFVCSNAAKLMLNIFLTFC